MWKVRKRRWCRTRSRRKRRSEETGRWSRKRRKAKR
jgi:hypothetical protein